MSLRNEWKFTFPSDEVRAIAEVKLRYHEDRFAFWQGEAKSVVEECKASGLSVQESVAGANYSSNSPVFGKQIVVDTSYQRDLNECDAKIKEHKKLINTYQSFIKGLSRKGERVISLDVEDIEFFWGDTKG